MFHAFWFLALMTLSVQDDPFLLEGHGETVEAVAVCSKEGWIASGDWDGRIRIWDLEAKRSLREIEGHAGKMINDLDAAPAAGILATAGDDGFVKLWDVSSGKKLQELRAAEFIVKCVALTSDGKHVATRGGEWDDEAHVWDVAQGVVIHRIQGFDDSIMALDFDDAGKHLAAGTRDGRVRIFEIGKPEALALFELGEMNIYDLAFSPSGQHLAAACGDHSVRVLDLEGKKEIARLSPIAAGEDDGNGMVEVVWAPDGKTLLTASTDNTARVWLLEKKTELARFEGHAESTSGVTFSKDGSWVISCGDDNLLRVSPMKAKKAKG
ncbi:MAG: WD40 repeat domain-containing protein [Planctomycetota bacterium]